MTIRHTIITMIFGAIFGMCLIGAFVIDHAKGDNRNDAVGVAGCIAEYTYTHPKGDKFKELVNAVKACNAGGNVNAAIRRTPRGHTCNAPCTIYFGKGMYEDMACWDYRGNGTAYMWRENDADCWGN